MKNRIVITGSTGAKAKRIIQKALSAGKRVRILTTNAATPESKAWVDQGATVLGTNYNDPEDLDASFSGAETAVIISPYWQLMFGEAGGDAHKAKELEIAWMYRVANALRNTKSIKEVVVFTLPSTLPYDVPCFQGKDDAKIAFDGLPVVFVEDAFYPENTMGPGFGLGLQWKNGKLSVVLPLGAR